MLRIRPKLKTRYQHPLACPLDAGRGFAFLNQDKIGDLILPKMSIDVGVVLRQRCLMIAVNRDGLSLRPAPRRLNYIIGREAGSLKSSPRVSHCGCDPTQRASDALPVIRQIRRPGATVAAGDCGRVKRARHCDGAGRTVVYDDRQQFTRKDVARRFPDAEVRPS
jgi:hypothetical protein